MNIHVLPFGTDASVKHNGVSDRPRPARPDGVDGQFARVYEASVLEMARTARTVRREQIDEIPEHLRDEMEAASRLFDELAARDERVRFDVHSLDRRVVVDLVDTDGNVLRPISLTDVVHSIDPDTAA